MPARVGIRRWIGRRIALLRHFSVVPRRVVIALALMNLLAMVTESVGAIAVGWLIARSIDVGRGAPAGALIAPLVVVGTVIVYQLAMPTLFEPTRRRVAQLVDGAVMHRIRMALAAPVGVAHLESQEYRDLVELPTAGDEVTIGTALEAQLHVISRYVAALIAAAIIASVSPGLAILAFALQVGKRLYLRTLYAPALSDWFKALAPNYREGAWWRRVGTHISAAKDLRVFGFADAVAERFDHHVRAQQRLYEHTFRRNARTAWPAWVGEAVGIGLPAYVMVRAALDGRVSVGHLAVLLGSLMALRIIGSVGNETYYVEATLTSVEALERLESLSRAAPHAAAARPASERPPVIRFEGVGFTYPGSTRPVISSLDLELRPGQSVAIVGENGVGKTTLLRLLSRSYEPTHGRITADGIDIRTLDATAWRAQLAIVDQNFLRLELSARHNIALADLDHPDREELLASAIDAAGAREAIAALPAGLDTVLSREYEGGAELSGGQWQRIALARALYAAAVGARVLALDEPTAHLDVEAELALFDQLLTHAAGTTAIVISHRYSTVRHAERIIVLGPDGVVEDGDHRALMAADGTYARLYRLQASAFSGRGAP